MTYTKFKRNSSEKTNKKGNNLQKLMKSERRKLEKINVTRKFTLPSDEY